MFLRGVSLYHARPARDYVVPPWGFLLHMLHRSRLALFALTNALLLAALSLRYLAVITLPSSGVTFAYVALAWIGQGVFLTLPLLALWQLARLPRTATVTAIAAVVIATATVAIAGIDTFVYQQYRFHIDGVVLAMLRAGGVIEFLSLTPKQLAMLAGVLAMLAVLQVLLWRATGMRALERARKGAARALGVLAVCWIASHFLFAWSSATHDRRITPLHNVLAWQPMLTANSFFESLGVAGEAQAGIAPADTGILHYPLQEVSCPATPKLNVLVILVDAWRDAALAPETMPNASAFANGALQFANHYSPSSSTRGGVFSLFYGFSPTYWLDAFNQGTEPVLVRCLREAGYTFNVHSSATLTNPEFDRTVFVNVPDIETSTPGATASERDAEITRRFVQSLPSDDAQRFFGFLFYDAAHAYDVPEGAERPFQPSWDAPDYFRLRNGTDPTPFVNLYRNAMYYIDREIGAVLAALRETGHLDDTLVIITGDHAQEFNDNALNYWGHNSNFSRAQTQVPLIVHWPGMEPGAFTHMTTHYDIAPTLLSRLFGTTTPAIAYSDGEDLFATAPRLPLLLANYTEYALMDEEGYIVIDRYQDVHVLGDDYRVRADAPDVKKLRLMMEKRTRFRQDAATAP